VKTKKAVKPDTGASAEAARKKCAQISAALWNSTETLRRIIYSMPAGMSISCQKSGAFIEVNDAFLEICEYGRDDVIGHTSAELGLWFEPERRNHLIESIRIKGYAKNMEMECRQKSGEIIDLLISAKGISIDNEECILAIWVDNSSQKKVEQALIESEALYKGVFLTSRDSVSIVSANEELIDFNDASLKVLGYDSREELLKIPTIAHFANPLDMLAGLELLKKEGYVQDYPLQIRRRDGSIIDVQVTAALLKDADGIIKARINTIRDVTEKKRFEEQRRILQAQLLQSQKMEAVGQLAGGIAHDFNNILSIIIGFGYIIQTKLAPDDPIQADLVQILESAGKAAEVTHSLLAFSRNQIINPLPWDINDLIRKSSKLLKRLIGEDIDFIVNLTNKDLICLVDAAQIDQVILNLATNARDAMPDGGVLTISTSLIALDEKFILTHGYGQKQSYALISVMDSGIGIDKDTLNRIFEPFFTTKPTGKGTGLGLSMVYGIMSQLGGHIEVKSDVGEGTTFNIYLPLAQINEAIAAVDTKAVPLTGNETILVAEDDEKLRELYKAILSKQGYSVILANDGDDAIRQFVNNRDKIRLILLDMIMPKKSGREVYSALKKIGASVEFLFASGYTADRLDKSFLQTEGIHFILKPVMPKDLLIKVREILETIKYT